MFNLEDCEVREVYDGILGAFYKGCLIGINQGVVWTPTIYDKEIVNSSLFQAMREEE